MIPEFIHGGSGIDGADLPEPARPTAPRHAVDFLIDTLLESTEPVTLATLGSLTNVALAIVKHPAPLANVREFVAIASGWSRQRHAGGGVQRLRGPTCGAPGIRVGGRR